MKIFKCILFAVLLLSFASCTVDIKTTSKSSPQINTRIELSRTFSIGDTTILEKHITLNGDTVTKIVLKSIPNGAFMSFDTTNVYGASTHTSTKHSSMPNSSDTLLNILLVLSVLATLWVAKMLFSNKKRYFILGLSIAIILWHLTGIYAVTKTIQTLGDVVTNQSTLIKEIFEIHKR